jgi:hypothetical protein
LEESKEELSIDYQIPKSGCRLTGRIIFLVNNQRVALVISVSGVVPITASPSISEQCFPRMVFGRVHLA